MGADSTLVNAAFRESATRAGANVPNLKPLYDSTVKQGRQSFGIITGIMDELKQDELNRIAGKDAQMQEFTGLVNKMDKMLAVDKVPLPQKVILAIEKGIKDLQLEFDNVNTYGDEDNRENERARTRINGELQKLISSAVNTRGGMMTIGKTIDNLNGIEFTDDNRAIASQMINLEDMDTDDRVSVGVANGQITFTASDYNTSTMFINPLFSKETKEIQYGDAVSWNIDQIIEAIPMKDLNADMRVVAGLKDAKLGGTAAQAEGQTKDSYNLEKAVRDIKATIKTKEDFANIAQREIEGTDIQGFRTALLGSGELQLELIEAMFTNDLGEVNPIYDTFAALDTDGVNGITSADARGLTGEAHKTWKDNSMALVDMITMTQDKNFNLEVSKEIISNYLGDHQRQEFEKAWTAADKTENPNKYKQTDISEGFKFNVNQGYTMVMGDGTDKWVSGQLITTAQDFISNPIEGKALKLYDGNVYSYKDGKFYRGEDIVTQSQISKNLGMWEYGYTPKDTYEEVFNEIPPIETEEKETGVPYPDRDITSRDFTDQTIELEVIDKLEKTYKDYPGFKFEKSGGQLVITSPDGKEKEYVTMNRTLRGNKESRDQIQAFIAKHAEVKE